MKVSKGLATNEDNPVTASAIDEITDEILPKAEDGFAWKSIEVFWYRLSHEKMESCGVFRTPRSCQSGNRHGDTHGDSTTKLFDASRPPDSICGIPHWRQCHMGILLKAKKTHGGSGHRELLVSVELTDDGIHVNHAEGIASRARDNLRKKISNSSSNPLIFTAGVDTTLNDMALEVLLQCINPMIKHKYCAVRFNCQILSSIIFHKFTGNVLSQKLRQRWTSAFGWKEFLHSKCAARTAAATDKEAQYMVWTANAQVLKSIELIDSSEPLFRRCPPAAGKANVGLVAAGLAGAIVNKDPAGLLIAAGGLCYDKIPGIAPLSRKAIWFRYDRNFETWLWTPYRDGEVEAVTRWYSVNTCTVGSGRFKGMQVKGTSSEIIRYLAANNPNPIATVDDVECAICMELKLRTEMRQGQCQHQVCGDCLSKIGNGACPFCRKPFKL